MASRRDIRLHLRPVVHWLIILSMTLPLLSCPNPLNTAIFLHVKDSVNPVVTIQSPEDGSSYGATVVVVGKVTDDATSEEEGEVRSLSYEVVPATLPGGNVPFEEDGSFTLTFETHDFAGPMIVRLEAVDWNGNRGEAELNVVDTGAIPSFQTVPGNGSVTLSWEQVPLSAGYSLYYTDDGTAPTAFHGEEIHGVESPFLLDGLGNGRLHTFLLQSHSSEGRDNWSTRIETIPLAPLTLAPTVTGGYGSIRVEWWPIPATDEFEVLRATSEEGPYEIIAAGSLGSSVLDTDVNRGTTYYYKVRPSLAGCEDSRPNSAQLACYPSAAERIIGSCLTPGAAFDVHLRGTTAFVAAEAAGLAIVDVSNPRAPRLVSQCDTPGSAWEVALEGNYAFVADDRSGLCPPQPRIFRPHTLRPCQRS